MSRNKQSGAALFIVLILLLVVTIIGVSSMNDTLMQGKMAGAMQDSNIALQGVETALRDAETYIRSLSTTGGFGPAGNGLYDEGNAPDHAAAATWTGTNSIEAGAVAGLADNPRYFIELAGEVTSDDTETKINVDTYSHETGGGTILAFRIVARSTGASGSAQRVVESYYGREF